ncbi:chemotaxis protein CheW [Algiphilus sp.]|uniref:chemotaxis protein CheW n=1 Tax=Algiphilus sp. TaxID=1872431 RepID=UPI0025BEDD97|nr:chemotaxis protein CheW [Algiphilus sp.]MCK5771043.1 purine-binding chemotaxis protein CheW [Algiphilus sp.]
MSENLQDYFDAMLAPPALPAALAPPATDVDAPVAAADGHAEGAGAGEAAEPREWVVFTLGGQDYGLDVHTVREIVRPPVMEPMPHAPATLVGMANLRGAVVAVFDTARLLGQGEVAAGPQARVIVLELGEDTVGLMVDAVSEILRFDGGDAEVPPELGASARHIVGLLRQPRRLVQQIDPDSLFA